MSQRLHDPDTEQRIIRDYQAGATLKELADRYGGSDVAAKNVLKRHNIPRRRAGLTTAWTGSPEQVQAVVSRYANRESMSAIAKAVGYDVSFVRQALLDAGIQIRDKGGSKHDLYTDEQLREIAERHASGESATSLARAYGISRKFVCRLIVRGGGEVQSQDDTWSQERHDEIKQRFLAGEKAGALAEAFGCHQSAISKSLNRSGVHRPKSGPGHHSWRGGRRIIGDGYVLVRPQGDDLLYSGPLIGSGYVLEHRLVMGRLLGRPLTAKETVHHKDLDHGNNEPSNLQLRQGKHGKGAAFACGDCGSHNVVAVPLAE